MKEVLGDKVEEVLGRPEQVKACGAFTDTVRLADDGAKNQSLRNAADRSARKAALLQRLSSWPCCTRQGPSL